MQYAKFISETEVAFPSQEDFNPDGELKDPSQWAELMVSPKPGDCTVFKDYTQHFTQIETGGKTSIYQSWTAVYTEPTGRVAKLVNGVLIFPKPVETINGRTCFGYDKLPNSRKIGDGWLLVEETEKPSDGIYTETGEIIPDSVYGQKIKIVWKLYTAPAPSTSERVEDLRSKYRTSTNLLCQLAGVETRDKLEDVEYESTVLRAMAADAGKAIMLTQTIMYCFFQLKMEDGTGAWDRI